MTRMTELDLSAEELLSTTRAVRKRLDLERPVASELIGECVELALQAPSGGNTQGWHFVVVYDAKRRAALGKLYAQAWEHYRGAPGSAYELYEQESQGPRKDQFVRVIESAEYLVDNLARVPVHLVACIDGRVDRISGPMASVGLASVYGSILPAVWSYMLAARARGLGTCWTTVHLMREREAAEILGIPYDEVTQVALIPTAHSLGTEFSAALRKPVGEVMHIDNW
jgi:nitroreductase